MILLCMLRQCPPALPTDVLQNDSLDTVIDVIDNASERRGVIAKTAMDLWRTGH